MQIYEYFWEPMEGGGARLLRVCGQSGAVCVPGQLEGHPVREIGAYCFADRAKRLEFQKRTVCTISSGEQGSPEDFSVGLYAGDGHARGAESELPMERAELRELSGDAVERVLLPDCVEKIESYAFYRCRNLVDISVGSTLRAVGGDAFMNCHRLHMMTVRGGWKAAGGIRQILTQITSDMEVRFAAADGTQARLLFPEYYESYDEIAPAHLFGRNIEGEGFRARQCVREGALDFALYDTIFPKACAEEREQTLCRLAMNRLQYPVELGEAAEAQYAAYVREHAHAVCRAAVAAEDEAPVWFLCRQGLLAAEELDACIRLATEQTWVRGAAGFLRAKEQFFAQRPADERYVFEDF